MGLRVQQQQQQHQPQQYPQLLSGRQLLPDQHIRLNALPTTIDPRILSLPTSSSLYPYSTSSRCTVLPDSIVTAAVAAIPRVLPPRARVPPRAAYPRAGQDTYYYTNMANSSAAQSRASANHTDNNGTTSKTNAANRTQHQSEDGRHKGHERATKSHHTRPPLQEISDNIAIPRSSRNKTTYTRTCTLNLIAVYSEITEVNETA